MQVYIEDYPTIQEAINKAVDNKMPLVFRPQKTYTTTEQLTVSGNLEIVGNHATIDSSAALVHTMYIENAALSLRIFDLTIVCIADGTQVAAIHVDGRETEDIDVYLQNVTVEGGEKGLITEAGGISSTGGGTVTLRDCEFFGQYDNCLNIYSAPDIPKTLNLFNCYFHDTQTSHLVYCHPHNDVMVDNCRFGQTPKYQFYLNGDNVNVSARYQLFSNSFFEYTTGKSLITDYYSRNVVLNGCVIESTVNYISSVHLIGCEFKRQGHILHFPVMLVPDNKIIIVEGCTWSEMDQDSPVYIDTRSDKGLTDYVYIKDSRFFAPDAPNTFNTLVAVGENGQFIKIDDCEFHGGLCDRGLRIEDAATMLVKNCYFDGDYDVSCIFEDGNPNNFVKVDDCTFNHSSGQIYSGGSPDVGRNNYEMGVGYFNFVSDGDKLLLEQ